MGKNKKEFCEKREGTQKPVIKKKDFVFCCNSKTDNSHGLFSTWHFYQIFVEAFFFTLNFKNVFFSIDLFKDIKNVLLFTFLSDLCIIRTILFLIVSKKKTRNNLNTMLSHNFFLSIQQLKTIKNPPFFNKH